VIWLGVARVQISSGHPRYLIDDDCPHPADARRLLSEFDRANHTPVAATTKRR